MSFSQQPQAFCACMHACHTCVHVPSQIPSDTTPHPYFPPPLNTYTRTHVRARTKRDVSDQSGAKGASPCHCTSRSLTYCVRCSSGRALRRRMSRRWKRDRPASSRVALFQSNQLSLQGQQPASAACTRHSCHEPGGQQLAYVRLAPGKEVLGAHRVPTSIWAAPSHQLHQMIGRRAQHQPARLELNRTTSGRQQGEPEDVRALPSG